MRQAIRRYWKSMAVVGFLFAVFFVARTAQITHEPERVSKRPVQIGEPLVLVRDGICLPGELKVVCDVRIP